MTQAPTGLRIDLLAGEFYANDPYPAFAWMRANAPLYYDEANDVWGVASYKHVKAFGADPKTFCNAGGHRPKFPALPMMVDMDAPEHSRHRKIVSAGFTPRRIAELTEHVRGVCDDVIDTVCERGECDFVRDIAAPLPLNMIGDLLGVPVEDRPELLHWSETMLGSQGNPDPTALEGASTAFGAYFQYMQPVFEDRLARGVTDDLVGILVHAEVDGERLDPESLVMESLLLLIGGDETTRHVLSGGMLELQRNPDQLAAVGADPSLLPTAVEEMLRWVTPIKDMVRTTTRDVEIDGVHIPEESELMLFYPSANRDETVFDSPELFDIRRDPNPHVAFGFGTHFCLGNQLARIELRVMFEQLLARLPDLRLSGVGPYPQRPSNFISGVEHMPVQFSPTPRVRT
jgi:cytochrome P450 family 142 subfamily A polypeptide 1